jgi:hypothetical protein
MAGFAAPRRTADSDGDAESPFGRRKRACSSRDFPRISRDVNLAAPLSVNSPGISTLHSGGTFVTWTASAHYRAPTPTQSSSGRQSTCSDWFSMRLGSAIPSDVPLKRGRWRAIGRERTRRQRCLEGSYRRPPRAGDATMSRRPLIRSARNYVKVQRVTERKVSHSSTTLQGGSIAFAPIGTTAARRFFHGQNRRPIFEAAPTRSAATAGRVVCSRCNTSQGAGRLIPTGKKALSTRGI